MNPTDPEVPYAFWLDPVTAVKVSYSLPLFHEIDFEVNEGYRRIPHGGVEVGGLLYGRLDGKSLSIEAFRPIACEHASGPSFHLSEKDLSTLTESILNAPKDEGLQGMVPVGWFIAHTRSGLKMTEREIELFARFFPEPVRVTMLVKPERYKPTRFAFLIRDQSGEINADGEFRAVILPLPGRPGKPVQPVPSIAELKPAESSAADLKAVQAEPLLKEEPAPLASEVPGPEPVTSLLVSPVQLPPAPPSPEPLNITFQTGTPTPGRFKRSRPGWLLAVLLAAALLGCGVGYWAYLQLPPPIISLRVRRQTSNLLIMWDPAQTRSSQYAVIRTNDGQPVLLTDQQRAAGLAQVPLAGESVKVEIVAPHWGRESRGIIRYVPALAF